MDISTIPPFVFHDFGFQSFSRDGYCPGRKAAPDYWKVALFILFCITLLLYCFLIGRFVGVILSSLFYWYLGVDSCTCILFYFLRSVDDDSSKRGSSR